MDDEERKFQEGIRKTPWFAEFKREYGEEPDLNTPEYDYRAAWKADIRPQRDKHDGGRYHWASSLPGGKMLKSENHPTAWKEMYMRQTGRNPDEMMWGYATRRPSESEMAYFKKNPSVTGMASEDGRIVLNHEAGLKPEQMMAVARNEAIRLYLRQNKVPLQFSMTPRQVGYFNGTPYAANPAAMRETILARIITGDASAQDYTQEQAAAAQQLLRMMDSGRNR